MNILLAVDGSAYSKKMLAYLSTHDALLAPTHAYTVLNVQHALPARAASALGKAVANHYYAEEADKVLKPVDTFLQRHGIAASLQWELGAPGLVIAQRAQDGSFDLLVMGSHGHTALGNLVMGSVTTQVLAHCKTPVLLVR